MPSFLGCVYPAVQRFEGSGSDGNLMAVEEEKGKKLYLTEIFCQQALHVLRPVINTDNLLLKKPISVQSLLLYRMTELLKHTLSPSK